MKWRRVSMIEVLDFLLTQSGSYRARTHDDPFPSDSKCSTGDGVVLSNGVVIVANSKWSGPYSEVTPDIDAEPPEFWIGTPEPKGLVREI